MLRTDVATTIVPSVVIATKPSTSVGVVDIPFAGRPRRAAILPGLFLSLVMSGASAVLEPRRSLLSDSSVVFAKRRPMRRRISLSEARGLALTALRMSDERWERFVESEAKNFRFLYGDLGDLRDSH